MLLERGDIDVVILNYAPLLLRHEILKHGRVLYERDKDSRCNFEVSSELEYYDFEPIREFFGQALKERIRIGEFGVKKTE